MSAPDAPRRARRIGWSVVAVLGAAILTTSGVAVAMAGQGPAPVRSVHSAAAAAPAVKDAPVKAPAASSSPTAAPTKQAAAAKAAAKAAAPKPQPTKAAAIHAKAPVVIKPAFTVKVTGMQAVQGQGQGPGEIGGPSVRFDVAITNTTGKPVDLTHTVVNAYYGSDATPAVQLQRPGGRPFPTTVANGRTVTGAFVFNIPRADRDTVQVTVDTSVLNPVVAFQGGAPR